MSIPASSPALCLPANLVCLDAETTGLDPALHGIISLGAVTLDGREFYVECRPDGLMQDVDMEALAVNGHAEDVYELFNRKRLAGTAVLMLCEWLRGLPHGKSDRKARFLHGGKNPQFDREFMTEALSRWNLANLRVAEATVRRVEKATMNESRRWAEEWMPLARRVVDVHAWAYLWALQHGKDLNAPGFSVNSVYRELGIADEVKPHHALNGAKHAMECFKKVFEQFQPRDVQL